jgi:hypothetical protein
MPHDGDLAAAIVEELCSLAKTRDISPHPSLYLGRGKLRML